MKRKAFTCGTCFKGFDTAKQAESHWLCEHEPTPATCAQCGLLLDEGYCHECEDWRSGR